METKLSFVNISEKEVFETLSELLEKEILDLLKLPCVNKKPTAPSDEQTLAERKELLCFLMKAKNASELNDLHDKFPSLSSIDEKYYEYLSSSCNKLLKVSFNIIRATKKCIAYLKIYKSYISTGASNPSAELSSMDYDLELLNLIASNTNETPDLNISGKNSEQAKESDNENENHDHFNDDEDYEEEETINKKRKLIAKRDKKLSQAKVVKVVLGTRSAAKRYQPAVSSDEEEEKPLLKNLRATKKSVIKTPPAAPLSSVSPAKSPAKEKPFHCDHCSFRTVSRNHLKLHLSTHKKKPKKATGTKCPIIKCKHCNFFAADVDRMSEHQKVEHNDTSEIKVSVLSEAANDDTKNPLNHSMDKMKQCDKCPYKTSDVPHLKRHKNNHNFVENFFKCRYCDYYLSKRSAMIQHEIIHGEYKPILNDTWSKKKKQSCPLCPYKANKTAHLKDHMAKHVFKEGYLKCRYCDYYVINNSALTQHEVIHSQYVQSEIKDRPLHPCPNCPFKSDKPCYLADHMLHHAYKEGYLKCRYCDYHAYSTTHMPQHEILHPEYTKLELTPKLFFCSKCPFQAKSKVIIKSHEDNHQYKENQLKCKYCDFHLSSQLGMRKHEGMHKQHDKKSNNTSNENGNKSDESSNANETQDISNVNETSNANDSEADTEHESESRLDELLVKGKKINQETNVVNKLPVPLSSDPAEEKKTQEAQLINL